MMACVSLTAGEQCSVVTFLHLRKCAGSSIRDMFAYSSHPNNWRRLYYCLDLAKVCDAWGCEPLKAAQAGGSGAFATHRGRRLRKHDGHMARIPPFNASSRWLLETHCHTNIAKFVADSGRLRAFARARGCSFASVTMLREPISMLISDYAYFNNTDDPLHAGRTVWALGRPEYLLLGSGVQLGHRHLDLLKQMHALRLTEEGTYPPSLPQPQADALERARAAMLAARNELHEWIKRRRDTGSGGTMTLEQWRHHWDELALEASAARGRWLLSLRHAGLLPCDALLREAQEWLGRVDVVGFVERFNASALLAFEAVGAQRPPTLLYKNPPKLAGTRAENRAAALTLDADARHPSVPMDELRLLRSLNTCSVRLFEQLLRKFDNDIAARPADFHAKLAGLHYSHGTSQRRR